MSDYDEKQEEQRRSQEAWNGLEAERTRQRLRGTNQSALGAAFQSCANSCAGTALAMIAVVTLLVWLLL